MHTNHPLFSKLIRNVQFYLPEAAELRKEYLSTKPLLGHAQAEQFCAGSRGSGSERRMLRCSNAIQIQLFLFHIVARALEEETKGAIVNWRLGVGRAVSVCNVSMTTSSNMFISHMRLITYLTRKRRYDPHMRRPS